MALTSATFQTTFRKDLTPDLQVADTTDYVTAGVNIADVTIFLKLSFITSSGTSVIYDNLAGVTPDITPSVSLTNTAVTPLPTTGDNITFGTYTIEAKYVVVGQSDVSQSYSYAYSWTPPSITISHLVNISTSTITTIDTTDYTSLATSITIVHTTSPPPNSGGTALVSSQSTNVYQGIYTGTWSDKVVSTVTFTFSSGLIVIDEIEGCIEFKVLSDIDINKVLCCVWNTQNRFKRLKLSNQVKYVNMLEETITPLNNALLEYLTYITAGCTEKAACALDEIIELTGCSDCGCDDGCSVPILPLANPATFIVVDSPDLSIAVVPQTVGNTVTYHIQVSATIQNTLAALYNTTVSTNTPTYITVTPTGTNPKNYAVDFIGALSPFGYPYKFSNSVTAANPTAGFLKFDNANLNAATAFYISDTEQNAYDITAILNTAYSSGGNVKSNLVVRNASDPSKYVNFNITGYTTHTGWIEFSIAPVFSSANAPFANQDKVLMTIDITGRNVVFSKQTDEVFNTGVINSSVYKYTSVRNTDLANDGDFLDVWAYAYMNDQIATWTPPQNPPSFSLVVKDYAGTEFYGNGGLILLEGFVEFHYSIHRVSSSVIRVNAYRTYPNGTTQVWGGFDLAFDAAQSFDIFIRTSVDAPATTPCGKLQSMTVTLNKK